MSAYYNEHDPFAAQWLRNLIGEGLIAPGDVDERSIVDVRPSELAGYAQCHFFAGIGGWSYALRLARWPDDRPVWTGSCPCQPFSAAGKGGGFDDSRHLWPEFYRLIRECSPGVVFGEQVASKDGLNWLDLVQTDMEAKDYAFAAVDLCAAGVGAPHIRQRLFWVADAMSAGRSERWSGSGDRSIAGSGATCVVANADEQRHDGRGSRGTGRDQPADGGAPGVLGDTDSRGSSQGREAAAAMGYGGADVAAGGANYLACATSDACNQQEGGWCQCGSKDCYVGSSGTGTGSYTPAKSRSLSSATDAKCRDGCPTNGHWRDADWLGCTDGKWRPVEPGTFPLAHGVPNRVGSLRGYGNAIVPQIAAEFIKAYCE